MKRFSIAVDIDAPAGRSWEVMHHIDRWHEWTPSVTGIKRLDDGAFAVGTRAVIRQPRLPPALWTITDIEPGRSFTWVSRAPGLTVVARHWVEPLGHTRSRGILSLEYRGLLGGILATLTKRITERYLALEAKGLKARSENPNFCHERT